MTAYMHLGRFVEHDERSLAFPAKRATKLVSANHVRHGKPFNQGQIGSCTGNAIAGALMTEPLWNGKWAFTEADALAFYEKATTLDSAPGSYPPDDTGSSSIAVAKAARALGYISAYHHSFGLDHMLSALVLSPGIIGTNWYDSMFNVTSAGEVQISPNASVAGGHEYEAVGLDVENRRVYFVNSWGSRWGQNGYFWMTWDTVNRLLHERGDFLVPIR